MLTIAVAPISSLSSCRPLMRAAYAGRSCGPLMRADHADRSCRLLVSGCRELAKLWKLEEC
eukprot:gene3790-5601_t